MSQAVALFVAALALAGPSLARAHASIPDLETQRHHPRAPLNFGAADALGHLESVDGLARGRDALGNASALPWGSGVLTISHDNQSRAREIMRPDGVGVRYGYRADGMRATREYVCPTTPPPGCSPRSEVLLYSGLQLLEVREVSPTARLRARYYYEDEGDVPYAADLWVESTSTLSRYYYLTDKQGSVVGVTDAAGAMIERVSYDPWGRPSVEPADTAAPVVSALEVSGGDLVLRASEAVLPAAEEVSSNGDALVTALRPLSEVVALVVPSEGDRVVAGTWRYVEHAGAERGRELRFTPSESLSGGQALAVVVASDGLLDSWSNAMAGSRLSLTWGSGVRWSGSSAWTGTARVSESAVGNEVLFQSHTYEWLVGLYHMRARLMEPGTGLFLERDPAGYEDAANVYALMRGDTINQTDPTGASVLSVFRKLQAGARKTTALARVGALGERLSRGQKAVTALAKKVKARAELRAARKADDAATARLDDAARKARTQPYGRVDVPPTPRSAKGGADEGFRLGKHGDMPSPRPGMESHHGVMSRWMEEHFPKYDADKAPAVLMPTQAHNATRGVYNRWRAGMRQKMGGTFEWSKVSEPEIRELGQQMFDASGTPKGIQSGYWAWFDRMKSAISR